MMDEKLAALYSDWRNEVFAWGKADCCQFALDAAKRLHDIFVPVKPYKTERGSVRVLRGMGGLHMALQNAGFECQEKIYPERGDIVEFKAENGSSALGVCFGPNVLGLTKDGLTQIEFEDWRSIWGVQCRKPQPQQ